MVKFCRSRNGGRDLRPDQKLYAGPVDLVELAYVRNGTRFVFDPPVDKAHDGDESNAESIMIKIAIKYTRAAECGAIEQPRSKLRLSELADEICPKRRHPRMFLSGVQFRIRLDSRLKHAGMTDFG